MSKRTAKRDNRERVQFIEKLLERVKIDAGIPHEDDKTLLIDILANIRHYCETKGVSWGDLLRVSQDHFITEWKEAGGK